MERYKRYKDSGVEWIGKIPEGWEVKPFRYIASNFRNGTTATQREYETSFPVSRIETISTGKINFQKTGYLIDQDAQEKYRMKFGDILLSHINSLEYVGNCAMYDSEKPLYHGMNLIRVTPEEFSKWLLWYLKSVNFRAAIQSVCKHAINQVSVPVNELKSIIIPTPPKPVQTAIANYLDRKTAEIDELIAQKERLIELYEEEKTAIINQAVTKGIDPDAKLKDSGVDWLGEIPEGWEVKKLKYLVEDIITGKTPPSSNAKFYNGDVNWFAPGDFNAEIELFDSKKKITDYAVEASGMKIFPEHTILLVGIGATVGKMGITKCTGTSNQQINAIIVKEDIINPHFALYFLLSFKTAIIRLANAATLPIFNQSQTKSFEIFIPDIDKQIAIVHHIETETARIDVKIAKTKKIIELQKEYRTALISEVVTGKIKVAA